MSKETNIEWADGTVNPTMGCDGCELWSATGKRCYAGVLHLRYGGRNPGFSPTFEQVTLHPGRMTRAAAWGDLRGRDRPDKPWLNGRPRTIFISDMSDALSRAVPFDYLKSEIIDNVTSPKGRRHVWMWLTKQAPRLAEFCAWLRERAVEWPANLWPGTSVTRQATVNRAEHLARVGNGRTTRFLSVEPLLEPVDLQSALRASLYRLVIVGGESGPGARPMDPDWARSIREQCKAAGVSFFMKQMNKKDPIPADLMIREFPNALQESRAS